MVGIIRWFGAAWLAAMLSAHAVGDQASIGRLAYLVSDLRIPFWDILWRGVEHQAKALDYDVRVYSAENSSRRELEAVVATIKDRVDGIVLAPTDSSAADTILKLPENAGIPVVIADGLTRELIQEDPAIRGIWLQGSDRYRAALDAIAVAGKTGQILLLCFDAEPEFLDIIPLGELLAAGMQQPFLMGEIATSQLVQHLNGQPVPRETQTDVLAISAVNIEQRLPIIRRNVLGLAAE